MALTKVNRGGLNTGVADSSNATFLTATAAEGVTLAGTLAVTGVHTVGTNAVATSEGGAVTTNVVQGLAKVWANLKGTDTFALRDSFNLTSATDNGTGSYTLTIANNMGNVNFATVCSGGANSSGRYNVIADANGQGADAASFFGFQTNTGSALDQDELSTSFLGDLA